LVGVEMVEREHGDNEIPRPVGQRILDAAEAHLLPAKLAGLEDHLGARVEAGNAGLGELIEQALRGFRGAEAKLEHAVGREWDRRDRLPLQLVIARNLLAHEVEVGLGVPVELRVHRVGNVAPGG